MKKLKQKTYIFFILFLLLKQILCLDPDFKLCVPKDCGDGLNISYPFLIKDLHDSKCGHPRFEVQCNNGSAVFNMSDNEYKVKDIVYEEKRVRVETAGLTKSSQKCENLDIRNFTIDWRFSIDNQTNPNLVLMSNCNSSGMDPGLNIYRVGSMGAICEQNTTTKYGMLKSDPNLSNMTRRCNAVVETPVMAEGGEGWRVNGMNYGEVMERGFEMTWLGRGDCGECAKSGGRCGFNATAREMICFCSDKPHRFNCKSATKPLGNYIVF